ncbi:hypothetical protein H5410_028488, partial [Solanum commersonii]
SIQLTKLLLSLACWNRDGNQSGHRERWKIVPACIWWTIWLERNQRCFENKSCSMEKMKLKCLALFYFWCKHEYPHEDEDITNIFNLVLHQQYTIAEMWTSDGWSLNFRRHCNDWEVQRVVDFLLINLLKLVKIIYGGRATIRSMLHIKL